MACRMLSVAAIVPAPLTKPVNTFVITVALGTVAALPTEVTSPVKFALVVTLPEVKPRAVPVKLVAIPDAGVPKAGATRVLLLKVSAPAKVASVPVVGNVTFVAPVAVNVVAKDPDVTKELPSAKVNVADVKGAVNVTLLTLVAVATPKTGVTKVGAVSITNLEPVPV